MHNHISMGPTQLLTQISTSFVQPHYSFLSPHLYTISQFQITTPSPPLIFHTNQAKISKIIHSITLHYKPTSTNSSCPSLPAHHYPFPKNITPYLTFSMHSISNNPFHNYVKSFSIHPLPSHTGLTLLPHFCPTP